MLAFAQKSQHYTQNFLLILTKYALTTIIKIVCFHKSITKWTKRETGTFADYFNLRKILRPLSEKRHIKPDSTKRDS